MYISTGIAGKRMGLSSERVRGMAAKGELEGASRPEGGHWRIPEESVSAYLVSMRGASVRAPALSEVMQAFDIIKRAVIAGIDAN